MESLAQDLRLALRSTLRRPTFTLVAVTSLAIGIGANSAIFAVANTLFLKGVPGVAEPERVVEIGRTEQGQGWSSFSYPDVVTMAEEVDALESVAAYDVGAMNLSDEGEGQRVMAMHVTSAYLDVMGVRPLLGRGFFASEDVGAGQHPVVILSHRVWQSRFRGDPDIVGRSVRLNREPYTVVGVLPETFRSHVFAVHPDIWVPLTQFQRVREGDHYLNSRGTLWLPVVARLAPGASAEQLDAQLATVFGRLAREFPESNRDRGARAEPLGLVPVEGRAPFGIVMATVAVLLLLVLAVTCANVAGMLLAKAAARERDVAVRLALGAGRGRLVRYLGTDALVIFLLGGAGGLALARWALPFMDLNRLVPLPFPLNLDFQVDWRVASFATAMTVATGLLFGVLPALRATRTDLASTLRDQAGGAGLRASRLRRVFVAGQIGVSLLLLAAGGLFLRSLQKAADIDVGFDGEGVYVTSLDLSLEGYGSPGEAYAFVDALLERVRAVPGVTAATVSTDLPMDGGSMSNSVLPEDRDPEAPGAWIQSYVASVTPQFFDALDLRLRQGRVFGTDDGADSPPVVLVNRTFAEMAWPGESPVGRSVEYGIGVSRSHTIIGVVDDTKTDMVTDGPAPQVYSLLAQNYLPEVHLAVETEGAAADLGGTLRQAILSVDPELAVLTPRLLEDYASFGTLPHRVGGALASALGLLALLLAAVGIYGVVAFSVTQRTREIGVRIALGASRGQVLGLVVRGGLWLALPGIAVGAVLAAVLGRLLQAILVEVSPLDPTTFGGVAALLLAVVVLATVVPARRAASVQPVEALRSD